MKRNLGLLELECPACGHRLSCFVSNPENYKGYCMGLKEIHQNIPDERLKRSAENILRKIPKHVRKKEFHAPIRMVNKYDPP